MVRNNGTLQLRIHHREKGRKKYDGNYLYLALNHITFLNYFSKTYIPKTNINK
jgi:hypothetical protein